MTEIERKFIELEKKKEKALILYFTAGFPSFEKSIEIIKKSAEKGTDLIEIGIPFSDPIADGPIIQYTSIKALENGINTDKCFKLASLLKNIINVPYLFMSYFNPIYKYGIEKFADRCVESGVSGLIIPDLPYEESFEIKKILKERNINLIYFLTPYTSQERTKKIVRKANGFIYFISIAGVTGPRESLSPETIQSLKRIKKIRKISVALGFGISNKEQIKKVKKYVDGIIIGSFFLKKIIDGKIGEFEELIVEFKKELKTY
ncbi:MAG: tryptophan synthase subunit alpha [Candidatus Omnitrophica bacterium]|nr:tryptophan synthase subunit alpha [Candidatus Omnitrophota bacterium]MCM8810529.1 tryptophan synthase subunit alpha [Candidatus Omnitrophota bacterium]